MTANVTLRQTIVDLERKHGGLRAASEILGIDAGYLTRLKTGEKFNPGYETLLLLGLIKVVTITYKKLT